MWRMELVEHFGRWAHFLAYRSLVVSNKLKWDMVRVWTLRSRILV